MDRDVYRRLDALEGNHWWFCGRRSIIRAVLETLIPQGRKTRLLEAGCGTGGNLRMLSDFGAVDAFELDDEARAIARHKMPLDIKPGRLPEGVPFAPDYYDIVLALDVLEHVEKDVESLASLRERLSPGGRLIVTVPAHPWMWSSHDVKHHHYRRYTQKRLREALRAAGLRPLRMSYFNMFLFPVAAAMRLMRNLIGGSSQSDDRMPSPAVNALLTSVFSAERSLVARLNLPMGVSLLAVAERV